MRRWQEWVRWWCRGQHVPATVSPRVAFHGGGVMVRAGVSSAAKTDLVFIEGILNRQRYMDKIHRPHVLPFLQKMPDAAPMLQDNNARLHWARIVHDFLQANNVNGMDWPALSPDLSCIEHVWYVLGRAVMALWTVTARCKIIDSSWQKNGPVSHCRLSGNSPTPPRTEFVIVNETTDVIRTVDFWNTFMDNPWSDQRKLAHDQNDFWMKLSLCLIRNKVWSLLLFICFVSFANKAKRIKL